MDARIVDSRKF